MYLHQLYSDIALVQRSVLFNNSMYNLNNESQYQSFFSDTSQAVLDPGLNEYQQVSNVGYNMFDCPGCTR